MNEIYKENKMTSVKTQYDSKDQDWMDGLTVYWFTLTGTEYGTGWEFENDQFGVVESGDDTTIVDCDGAPLTEGDHQAIAVRNSVSVTNAMRAE